MHFCIWSDTRVEREDLWSDLKKNVVIDLPSWLILGDFNAIMKFDERIGNPVQAREVEEMQQCMNWCQLMELKSSGQYYTWNNKQEGSERIFCRLDRALGNDAWFENWPNTEVINLPEGEFDDCPLLVKSFQNNVKKKPFHFFNMWC